MDIIKEVDIGSGPGEFELVIGESDLRLINDTFRFPFRAIGRFGNLGCAGFLVDDKIALTAAHCVYDTRRGGRPFEDLDFSPGINGVDNAPLGVMRWLYARVPWQYAENQDDKYDFAVVGLEDSFFERCAEAGLDGCERVFEYGADCEDQSTTLNLAGYREDVEVENEQKLWVSPCRDIEVDCESQVLKHTCDSTAGMAGAPLWTFYRDTDNKIRHVVRGIHIGQSTSGNKINEAVVLNVEVLAKIQEWLDWGSSSGMGGKK